MPKLKFLVSLITQENDYQQEQAHAAQIAGQRAFCDCFSRISARTAWACLRTHAAGQPATGFIFR
jgi:hypothetical protein